MREMYQTGDYSKFVNRETHSYPTNIRSLLLIDCVFALAAGRQEANFTVKIRRMSYRQS